MTNDSDEPGVLDRLASKFAAGGWLSEETERMLADMEPDQAEKLRARMMEIGEFKALCESVEAELRENPGAYAGRGGWGKVIAPECDEPSNVVDFARRKARRRRWPGTDGDDCA